MIVCPYCDQEAKFMSSKEFYGKDYKSNLYVCKPCDAYVGTHGESKKALGSLANKELRAKRMEVHRLFDPLWKGRWKKMSRSEAYTWLRDQMGLSYEEGHIGMFNIDQCNEIIGKLKKFRGIK